MEQKAPDYYWGSRLPTQGNTFKLTKNKRGYGWAKQPGGLLFLCHSKEKSLLGIHGFWAKRTWRETCSTRENLRYSERDSHYQGELETFGERLAIPGRTWRETWGNIKALSGSQFVLLQSKETWNRSNNYDYRNGMSFICLLLWESNSRSKQKKLLQQTTNTK